MRRKVLRFPLYSPEGIQGPDTTTASYSPGHGGIVTPTADTG